MTSYTLPDPDIVAFDSSSGAAIAGPADPSSCAPTGAGGSPPDGVGTAGAAALFWVVVTGAEVIASSGSGREFHLIPMPRLVYGLIKAAISY